MVRSEVVICAHSYRVRDPLLSTSPLRTKTQERTYRARRTDTARTHEDGPHPSHSRNRTSSAGDKRACELDSVVFLGTAVCRGS